MPEISRFYGIIIKMYFADHLPPHFHAEYGDFKAQISITTGDIIEGKLPIKQLKLVQAWIILHEEEILENFNSLRKDPATWVTIEPLR